MRRRRCRSSSVLTSSITCRRGGVGGRRGCGRARRRCPGPCAAGVGTPGSGTWVGRAAGGRVAALAGRASGRRARGRLAVELGLVPGRLAGGVVGTVAPRRPAGRMSGPDEASEHAARTSWPGSWPRRPGTWGTRGRLAPAVGAGGGHAESMLRELVARGGRARRGPPRAARPSAPSRAMLSPVNSRSDRTAPRGPSPRTSASSSVAASSACAPKVASVARRGVPALPRVAGEELLHLVEPQRRLREQQLALVVLAALTSSAWAASMTRLTG